MKFSVLYNTSSDWLKAVFAGVGAVVPVITLVQADGITPTEWVTLVTTFVLAFAAGLGLYSEKDVDTPGDSGA